MARYERSFDGERRTLCGIEEHPQQSPIFRSSSDVHDVDALPAGQKRGRAGEEPSIRRLSSDEQRRPGDRAADSQSRPSATRTQGLNPSGDRLVLA